MTADVVPLSKRRRQGTHTPEPSDYAGRDYSLTPRALAIEQCADRIERALRQRLTIDERIGLERALDDLIDDVVQHPARFEWGWE